MYVYIYLYKRSEKARNLVAGKLLAAVTLASRKILRCYVSPSFLHRSVERTRVQPVKIIIRKSLLNSLTLDRDLVYTASLLSYS